MKKVSFFIFYLIISYFILNSSSVLAQKLSTQELELYIKNYVYDIFVQESTDPLVKVEVTRPKISSRTEFHECNDDIELDVIHNNGRNINIKASCTKPSAWRIYTPLKVSRLLPVLMSATNLNKGSLLTSDNTKISYIEEHKIRGATLNNNYGILGAKIKRNLQKENAIYNSYICTVCKGDTVTIIATSSGFNIKTEGTALANANINEQIKIRNNSSGKVVSARVKSINKVVINL